MASSLLRRIYDLDTLDTRFTTSSTTPYRTVVDARSAEPSSSSPEVAGDRAAAQVRARAGPSRWSTPEFYLYYLVFALAVPYMFWVPYTVSRPSDPRYHKFESHLSPGWVPGRKIDVSDAQYHTFRENLPYMGLLLVLHPLLRRAYGAVSSLPRLEQRLSFDFAFALVFLVALHGFSSLKVLLIVCASYRVAKGLPRSCVPAATWAFNVGILFANELCRGYRYGDVARLLSPGAAAPAGEHGESQLVRLGEWMDGWGGLMGRWEILFNITVLRLISFNMDYYWSQDRRHAVSVEKKQLDLANLSERDRVTVPASPDSFSLRNAVAYAVYAPLYLTGPIITFNDFMAQQRHRPASIEPGRTARYAVRFLLALLCAELVLHFDYVGAISHSRPVWGEYTASQLCMLSFFNLHIIWLKLLLPWRLFRLWALVDGVDPPENMLRCVSDNYSALSFWRSWHRSYNRWLIRYLYVPLGGASFATPLRAARSVVNYLLVFTFVALWHDIQLRLLIWGWLIVLFLIPEALSGYLFPRRKWESRPTAYRMLCAAGAVANVIMMMMANLVGFAVGLDGLESIIAGIFQDWFGVVFLVLSCSALFVGIQVMFEIRQAEMRRGIHLKC